VQGSREPERQLVIAESRKFLPFFLHIRAVGLPGIVNWSSATDSNTGSTTLRRCRTPINISRFPAEAIYSKTPIFVFFKNKHRFYFNLRALYIPYVPESTEGAVLFLAGNTCLTISQGSVVVCSQLLLDPKRKMVHISSKRPRDEVVRPTSDSRLNDIHVQH
jgi:hypothetical protein